VEALTKQNGVRLLGKLKKKFKKKVKLALPGEIKKSE
jgi:protein required for attachment to host cells